MKLLSSTIIKKKPKNIFLQHYNKKPKKHFFAAQQFKKPQKHSNNKNHKILFHNKP